MIATAAAVYGAGFREGLRPDRVMTVSEWADEFRELPQKSSSEPGRWRTSRTPYLREIMDCLSASSAVISVALMKGAQVGGTEAILNALGYIVDQVPGPTLAVLPTVELAKRWSRQRLEPLLEGKIFEGKIADSKARDKSNTMLSKDFRGGQLIATGANSAVGLRSMPARYLLLDEVDGYPLNIDDEGDPISLAEARQRTFARRKIIKVSTPTVAGKSRIEAAYEAGDQRRYYVPCPHCQHMQPLEFARLAWKKLGLAARDAVYLCSSCDEPIENYHKTRMLERGEWRAENPGADPRHRSYHLSSLYSPVGWMSWGEIAEEFEKAEHNQDKLRVFVNTILGETWQEKGEAPDWQRLYDRREHYLRGTLPAGALFVTAGVDVQKIGLYYEVVGWGRGKESWSIDAGVIPGNPEEEAVWKELDALLDRKYPHESGVELGIASLAVDSGAFTQKVYGWARRHPMPRVIAIKGNDGVNVLISAPVPVDVSISGRKLARGYKYWPVSGNVAKSELYGWLKLERPTEESGDPFPAGYCHFPEYGEEYFKQVTAEQQVFRRKKNGFSSFTWELIPGRENHYLDARVYARAAAAVLGLDRYQESDWRRLERDTAQAPKAAPAAAKPDDGPAGRKWISKRPTGWLKRRRP